MITDFISYGSFELEQLVVSGRADPYDVIDELARRIRNRRIYRRNENHLAIKTYARLAVRFNYKPLRPIRGNLKMT